MITIKDISKLTGISKSTISRVASKSGFVKDETREKVEAAMKELNYRPNMFAKGMRTNKSHSIGIIFPELSNPYFSDWYEIVDRIARQSGYMNYICITDPEGETEEKRLDDLVARNIDGIIMFTYCKHPFVIKKMQEISKHTPLICSDAMMEDTGLSCIYADGKVGTYQAVNSLLKQGRKRIAYVGGKAPFLVVERRAEGYRMALKEQGMPLEDELFYASNFKKECGYKAAEYFMQLTSSPDAIVASTDALAIGVLEYLNKNGIKIPDQVAVFGCNNQKMTESVSPSLSTIGYPIQKLAEVTINTLVKLIEHPQKEIVKQVFDCELVFREST